MLVLSKFQTNQGVAILKNPQKELNRYLFFTAPIHHKSIISMSYVIQSYYMKTMKLVFVSFCDEILEKEEAIYWVNERE